MIERVSLLSQMFVILDLSSNFVQQEHCHHWT